jgi:uracil-DNA glycosylase family 4
MIKPEQCRGCPLFEKGEGYAFGEGPQDSKVLLLGEALGAEEAKQGRPFVGGAGRTLNYLLAKANVRRSELFITNVCRCRPPENRIPLPEEIATCMDRHETLEFLKKFNLVVLMGNTALSAVTGHYQISRWRGSVFQANGVKVLPTMHPAAVMRQQDLIPIVILDLMKIGREGYTSEYFEPIRNYTYNADSTHINQLLATKDPVCVDVETNSLRPTFNSLTRVGVGREAGNIFVVKDIVSTKTKLSELLGDPERLKIGQNIMFDIRHLRANGIEVSSTSIFDTMVAHHLILGEVPCDLGFIASIYTRIPYWKHLIKQELDFYNATDVDATFRIYEQVEYELKRLGLKRVFNDTMQLLPLLSDMSLRGVAVDRKLQLKWRVGLEAQIRKHEELLLLMVGDKGFNWRSTRQLSELLYGKLKLPKIFAKGKENTTTNEDALKELRDLTGNKIVDTLLSLRKLSKLSSTYFSLEETYDGRVHSEFLVHITPTGRLASRDPNLQNVPKGPARAIYIPDPGHVFVHADYNQIELRIAAKLAGETRLLEAFEKGEDVHKRTASLVYHVAMSEVTDQQRFKSKMMVYGLGYGRGAVSIAKEHKMSVAEAQRFIDEYFLQFQQIARWRKEVAAKGQQDGYLVNPYGHRRYFFGQNLVPKMYNYIPQSTAAYVLIEAMLRLHERLPTGAWLWIQVHDELGVQCPEAMADQVAALMKEVMEEPIDVLDDYRIPVKVHVGKNWEEASR